MKSRVVLMASLLLAGLASAQADIVDLACKGEMQTTRTSKPFPLEFSVQLDSSTNEVLQYTLWGGTLARPTGPVVASRDGELLTYMYIDEAAGLAHLLGIDRINGQFRHIEARVVNGELDNASRRTLVKASCKKATALF